MLEVYLPCFERLTCDFQFKKDSIAQDIRQVVSPHSLPAYAAERVHGGHMDHTV